jgi:DNA-binding PadR family transcriptional regulator
MARNTVSNRYFILGLLNHRSMSGYDIRSLLEGFSWLLGSPSYGSLYPMLHTLLEEGLVSVDVISGQNTLSRKLYSITEAGREALQEQFQQPMPDVSLKAFVMRLMLAHNFSRTKLKAYLDQRRSQVAGQSKALEPVFTDADEEQAARDLAFDYGMKMAEAELAWLESKLEQLSQ